MSIRIDALIDQMLIYDIMATCLLILINKVSFDLVANVGFFYSGYFIFTGDENATKQYEWMCSLSLFWQF